MADSVEDKLAQLRKEVLAKIVTESNKVKRQGSGKFVTEEALDTVARELAALQVRPVVDHKTFCVDDQWKASG